MFHTTDDYNRLHIECEPLSTPAANGQPRIKCTFFQTSVRRPKTQAEVDAEVAAFEKKFRDEAQKQPAKVWADCSKGIGTEASRDVPDDVKAMLGAWKSACDKRDVAALARAFSSISGRATKTCKLETYSNKEVLTRLDANTWSANVGPRGLCNVSLMLTLWQDKTGAYLWNYKQIRNIPETEHGPLCDRMDRVSVSEWRWNGNKNRKLGCEYIE